MLLESNHFSSGLSSDSNSTTDDSELHSVFRWSLYKNRNRQSKTNDTPSRVRLEHPFTKFISIMKKGWITILRLTNHLYIKVCLSASTSLTTLKSSSYGTTSVERTSISVSSVNTRAASHVRSASVRLAL